MTNLTALWNQAENKSAAKASVVDGARRLTYRQVGDRIRRITAGLIAQWRVRAGEVVAVLVPNCAEFVISYFALTGAGAVVQPVDERLTHEEMKAMLLDSGARYVIIHRRFWPKFEKIRCEIPALEGVLGIDLTADQDERFEDWLSRPFGTILEEEIAGHQLAELMYTSGTTGEPKGVMRSHSNVLAAARNSITAFGYRGSDVMAIVMPLSHSSALNSQMIPMLQVGGRIVLVDQFEVRRISAIIQNEEVTCIRVVPTMMRMLLASLSFNEEALPSLRLLINSSAPIDPEMYREVKRRFRSIEVMNSYGLTEASTCTILPDHMVLSDAESVGHAIEGVEITVRDEEGRILGDLDEGEFFVRGEHVFRGYHNRPEATRNALLDGWLRTGDLGYRDARGLYYLNGRKNELINCGGRKFAPVEVETCIMEIPEVCEVAVVGVSHRILGQVAKAFVVPALRNGFGGKQIVQHCARNLPSYKVPFSVVFVSELPKTSTGKFLHRKLVDI